MERRHRGDDGTAIADELSAYEGGNSLSGDSASTITADVLLAGGVGLPHFLGRVTPAGVVTGPTVPVAAGIVLSRAITLSVRSSFLSAATTTLACDPTSKMME